MVFEKTGNLVCIFYDHTSKIIETTLLYQDFVCDYALINLECGPYAKIFVVTSCGTDRTK